MISTRHRLIFIHTPKTGGNAVQAVLQPISDDQKTINGHQDGLERFGLEGPITPHKHASLATYAEHVDLGEYTVAIGCRHPVDRLVSAYFSPHRWFEQINGRWLARTPEWDVDAFAAFARETRPVVDRLKVGSSIHRPEYVIRYEPLLIGLNDVLRHIGLPEFGSLPERNRSFASVESTSKARRHDLVIAMA